MNQIITIVIKILGSLLAIAGTYGIILFKSWLEEKIGNQKVQTLEGYIAQFVAAAEQQFREDDPDGIKRMEYVTDLLQELGYAVTDKIKALIEAEVYKINLRKITH